MKAIFLAAGLVFALSQLGPAEAHGRSGSHRVGGYGPHGRGSHYVGGDHGAGSHSYRVSLEPSVEEIRSVRIMSVEPCAGQIIAIGVIAEGTVLACVTPR
jgi:hypothetical protein